MTPYCIPNTDSPFLLEVIPSLGTNSISLLSRKVMTFYRIYLHFFLFYVHNHLLVFCKVSLVISYNKRLLSFLRLSISFTDKGFTGLNFSSVQIKVNQEIHQIKICID